MLFALAIITSATASRIPAQAIVLMYPMRAVICPEYSIATRVAIVVAVSMFPTSAGDPPNFANRGGSRKTSPYVPACKKQATRKKKKIVLRFIVVFAFDIILCVFIKELLSS